MAVYTKRQMAEFLRRCAGGQCSGCPFDDGRSKCDGDLMKAAAEIMEADIEDQARGLDILLGGCVYV